MTLQLRQRHGRMLPVLGVVIGLLFLVGIVTRRPVPETDTLPTELAPQTQTFSATGDERSDLFENSPVRVRLWREQETGSLAVGFTAERSFLKPDLLAYWSPSPPEKTNALPPEATLLGAFIAGPLVLPAEASARDGSLILFSVANQEIVGVSKPTRFNGKPK